MSPVGTTALPSSAFRHRRPLDRSRAALADGKLTLGFLGGSITAPKTGTRWPEPFTRWIGSEFPSVQLRIENAAVGATGSDLAAFRVQSHINGHSCDLVFVEYAVNDVNQPTESRNRTREGVLRQLLAAGSDVVLVYAFCPEMLADMEGGRTPPSVAEFEVLAEYYGVGSVWMGLHSWNEVRRGLMSWSEWLPDGLHPESRGSLSYAQSVIAFLETELSPTPRSADAPAHATRTTPLYDGCWDRTSSLPLEATNFRFPWSLQRWCSCLGMDRALHTTVPGARLQFSFDGRGLVLGFDFGARSGEVRHRVDGGEWTVTARERPSWVGDSGWYRPTLVAENLSSGKHSFELETLTAIHPRGASADTTIGLIGVLP